MSIKYSSVWATKFIIFSLFLFISRCEKDHNFQSITKCLEENETEASSICLQQWRITTIDSNVGIPTIAIDSRDNIHIGYNDKYVTNISGKWNKYTMSFGIKFIRIDQNDNVHIFSTENVNKEGIRIIHFIQNSPNKWQVDSIDLGALEKIHDYCIDIDSKNNIHIVYYTETGEIKYATNVTGQWESVYIDEGNLDPLHVISMIIDTNNIVHLAYAGYPYPRPNLRYAINASGVWQFYFLDYGYSLPVPNNDSIIPIVSPYITTDSKDNIYISYISESKDPNYPEYDVMIQTPKYITNASGRWESYPFPGSGLFHPFVVDRTGNLHIVYDASVLGKIIYLTNNTGKWRSYTIDECRWSNVALAMDSQDTIHIVYSGGCGTKYATKIP